MRYVLKVIGYKEIVPYLCRRHRRFRFLFSRSRKQAGAGYELAFFDDLEKRHQRAREHRHDSLQLCGLQACVKHLQGAKTWTRACDTSARGSGLFRARKTRVQAGADRSCAAPIR